MTFQHILVPVDDSDISQAAIKQAIQMAKAFNSKITAVCVIAVDPFVGVDFYNVTPVITEYFIQAEAHAKKVLARIESICAQVGIASETRIIKGEPTETGIVHVAHEIGADLIVIGSHGRTGLKKLMLGSVAQDVLNKTHIPVLVVK